MPDVGHSSGRSRHSQGSTTPRRRNRSSAEIPQNVSRLHPALAPVLASEPLGRVDSTLAKANSDAPATPCCLP
jgi:hypothetical protein